MRGFFLVRDSSPCHPETSRRISETFSEIPRRCALSGCDYTYISAYSYATAAIYRGHLADLAEAQNI